MTLQEISYALREGVAPRRVGTIARERGVAFDVNAEHGEPAKKLRRRFNLIG
jgi:hypothetical protein